MKPTKLFFLLVLYLAPMAWTSVTSNTGVIDFDVNADSQTEMKLNSMGLGVGSNLSPSANLHISGNAIVSQSLTIGSSTLNSSNLNINGSFGMSFQNISSNTSLGSTSIVLADSSAGNLTLTLPEASTCNGTTYYIKKISSQNNIVLTGSNDIDDKDYLVLTSGSFGSVSVISESDGWFILNRHSSVEEKSFDWTPLALSPSLWLDASDSSTVLAGAAGNVGTWQDKSGNNNHATQNTLLDQPITASRTLNGLNAIDFDGAEYFLELASDIDFVDKTIFVLLALDGSDTHQIIGGDTIKQIRVQIGGLIQYTGSTHNWSAAGAASFSQVITYASTTILQFDGTNPGRTYMNGTVDPTTHTRLNTDAFNLNHIGSINETTPAKMDGLMGEVIILPATPSDSNRQRIEGYLAHKWSMESSLPNSHIFRYKRPQNYPILLSATADDPDNGDQVLSNGDTITLVFDQDTNSPAVATKTNLDAILHFGGYILGSDYTGSWNSADILVITVNNASGGTLSTGATIGIHASGGLTFSSGGSPSVAVTNLTGDFGI